MEMQAGHYSSLLPEVFRHKTTRVRVYQPLVVLLDFHGTISERRWEDKVIFPYVKRTVGKYLRDNWANDTVQKCIPGLRNESFEQRFRHKYEDAPVVDDQIEGQDLDPVRLASQLGEFVQWQMNTKRETRETQLIERLVWQDGFKRRQILTPLYDDVMPSIKQWHDRYKCSIYVISSIDVESQKLLFENTDSGNLDQYIAGYWASAKIGDKLISDTYKRFYDRLSAPLKGVPLPPREDSMSVTKSSFTKRSPPPNGSPKSPSSPGSSHRQSSSSPPSIGKLGARSGSMIEAMRPVLFLTDSGQEAKAASLVNDGNTFECILINRPGNKRIRTYYLSQFQYVDKFQDIEFVPAATS